MKKLLGYIIMFSPFIVILILGIIVNPKAVLGILAILGFIFLSVFLMSWGSKIVEDNKDDSDL